MGIHYFPDRVGCLRYDVTKSQTLRFSGMDMAFCLPFPYRIASRFAGMTIPQALRFKRRAWTILLEPIVRPDICIAWSNAIPHRRNFLQPGCNMTCRFCATEDGFQNLTLEQGIALTDGLVAAGVARIILGGGEPFAWKPGALRLAKAAKQAGAEVQIGTNGIAMPEGYADCPWVDRYILPLESADASLHDRLRLHLGGHHRLVLQRLHALGRAGKSVTLSTVVNRLNSEVLLRLGRLLSDYQGVFGNLHAWHLYRMLPIGRGGALHGRSLGIGLDEYRKACDTVREDFPDLRILKRPDILHSKSVGFFWMHGDKLRAQSPYGLPSLFLPESSP